MNRSLLVIGTLIGFLSFTNSSFAQKKRLSHIESRLDALEAENKALRKEIQTLQLQLHQALKVGPSESSTIPIAGSVGETQVPNDVTTLRFDSDRHDFGIIKATDKVTHIYTFTNTGKQPLKIENVKASCGCTIPKWTKKSIAPGKQGEIQIVFNAAGKRGPQHKVVTVTANTAPANTRLYLQAYIE